MYALVLNDKNDQSNHFILRCLKEHYQARPDFFLAFLSGIFLFSLLPAFPLDSQMTSEQIEQNINCPPNLC